MKKALSILLALLMAFTILACAAETPAEPEPAPEQPTPAPEPEPEPTPEPEPAPPVDEVPDVFLWSNFVGYDPQNPGDMCTNGVPRWWSNAANLRAAMDGDVLQINFRPGGFDPEDYLDEDDFFARAFDWMGNWGEALDIWALEGISWCSYFTIRMAGAEGGEENSLILHFQPEDGDEFVVLFTDLVTQGGGSPAITTEMQDIVIDLAASGLPGMTNRMHIRAFRECTIFLDELYFSGPISPVDSTSRDTILAGITVPAMPFADINLRALVPVGDAFIWGDFAGRDPQNRPETNAVGMPIWWDNWANMRATTEGDGVRIDFRPEAFDPDDDLFDDEADYFSRAMDWMGNWGEAVDMWAIEGIASSSYLTFRMAGGEGGEEDKLLLHFQPEDGPIFMARFSDLVAQGGGNVEITTDMQDVVIDLAASGFPGMTNRMHIRAFAPCVIYLETIFFTGPNEPISDGNEFVATLTGMDIDLGEMVAGFVADLG